MQTLLCILSCWASCQLSTELSFVHVLQLTLQSGLLVECSHAQDKLPRWSKQQAWLKVEKVTNMKKLHTRVIFLCYLQPKTEIIKVSNVSLYHKLTG